MLEPRQEFASPEYKRYAAECRRLAAIAKPLPKAAARKPEPASKLRSTDWFGLFGAPFRAPKRGRKLAATLAHR
jgi:hypothetical protein